MKKLVIVVVLLVVLAAVAFAVRTLGARDETTRVDSKDAKEVVESRVGDSDGANDAADADVDPGLRPVPGTYRYSGSGSEEVDVLNGSRHVFPDSISLVVELDAADDCAWTSSILYVEEHVEQRRFCTTDDALFDRGFERQIEFFNRTQEAVYECDDDARRMRRGAKAGDSWSWTCREGDDTEATYTAKVVGTEQLKIGGEPVDAVRTRVESDLTGTTNGRDVSEFWFLESGLAAKFTTNLDVVSDSVLGETRFQERTSYTLTSLVPVEDG